ncbi:hypothetical protein NX059_012389 [Plenodomus lindquistii]|nr:hypothetical protein NX059_012389 [Plenodomus lindquistii]
MASSKGRQSSAAQMNCWSLSRQTRTSSEEYERFKAEHDVTKKKLERVTQLSRQLDRAYKNKFTQVKELEEEVADKLQANTAIANQAAGLNKLLNDEKATTFRLRGIRDWYKEQLHHADARFAKLSAEMAGLQTQGPHIQIPGVNGPASFYQNAESHNRNLQQQAYVPGPLPPQGASRYDPVTRKFMSSPNAWHPNSDTGKDGAQPSNPYSNPYAAFNPYSQPSHRDP